MSIALSTWAKMGSSDSLGAGSSQGSSSPSRPTWWFVAPVIAEDYVEGMAHARLAGHS